MIPAIVATIVRSPAAASLAGKLAQKVLTKADDHGVEDAGQESEETRPCKKTAQKMQISTVGENKYIGMQERVNILKFLKNLNEKNYAQANKYLKSIVEQKLMKRISKNKNVRVF